VIVAGAAVIARSGLDAVAQPLLRSAEGNRDLARAFVSGKGVSVHADDVESLRHPSRRNDSSVIETILGAGENGL
jgi:hypothetical protein